MSHERGGRATISVIAVTTAGVLAAALLRSFFAPAHSPEGTFLLTAALVLIAAGTPTLLLMRRVRELETEQRRGDDVLERERSTVRALIDNLPDFIYVKDAEGRFLVANEAVARQMGTTPQALLGRDDFDFYPKEF